MKIKKAIIPVAGYGTRFLPYTKSVPKAMLPILNKPAIQVICDEVVSSGITEILFIVGYKKEVIDEYFSASEELDNVLQKTGKFDFLKEIKYPETMAKISYVEQTELNGTAKAIELAKDFVQNEPFAVLFGDDIMYNENKPVIKQLIEVYEKTDKTVIGCKNVEKNLVPLYASVEYSKEENGIYSVTKITEKPKLEEVKSTLSPLGRYVLKPNVFDVLKTLQVAKNGEYQLTDAFDVLAKNNDVCAYNFEGVRYDMGSRLGYLKANVEFALRDSDLAPEFTKYLKDLVGKI